MELIISRYLDEDNIGDKFVEDLLEIENYKFEVADALRLNPKLHILAPGSILAYAQ